MGDTGPCERCGADIGLEANRCPDCGYEPSALLRAKVIAILAVPVFLVSADLVLTGTVATPVFVFSPTGEKLQALALPAVLASGAVLVGYYRQDERKPTDSTIF